MAHAATAKRIEVNPKGAALSTEVNSGQDQAEISATKEAARDQQVHDNEEVNSTDARKESHFDVQNSIQAARRFDVQNSIQAAGL